MRWLRAHVVHLVLFVVGLVGYGAVAGDRLGKPSAAPHFVVQADAWLDGRTTIDPKAAKGDDWARVETVILKDGERRVRGRTRSDRKHFQIMGGGVVGNDAILRREKTETYMSFPPLPAVLMVPQVLIAGRGADDVLFTVVFAAAVLPLLFATLRRLVEAGLSERTVVDDLWLVGMFGFGTVFFFAAVQGKVWYTAHVVGVFFALAYAWASIEARHPILAGLALGLATMTRTPMAFMFPLLLLEAWRVAGGLTALRDDRRAALRAFARRAIPFAIPILAIAIPAALYNLHRFGGPTEFGHTFLDVRQQDQIEKHGLFSYQYLGRNLAVAFTLLPELPGKAPWIRISGHGLAMWVTTPALLLLLWPRARPPIHRALWVTVAAVAVPALFYQNSGWFQFGYRFALDYLPFLVLLLAIGGRRLGWVTRGLIIAGVVVNLFGALTFDRHNEYYRGNYDVIVAH